MREQCKPGSGSAMSCTYTAIHRAENNRCYISGLLHLLTKWEGPSSQISSCDMNYSKHSSPNVRANTCMAKGYTEEQEHKSKFQSVWEQAKLEWKYTNLNYAESAIMPAEGIVRHLVGNANKVIYGDS